MNLYEQEKRVGEYYAAIGEIVRNTWRIRDMEGLLSAFAEQIGRKFACHTAAIFLKRGNKLHLYSFYQQQVMFKVNEAADIDADPQGQDDLVIEAARQQKARQSSEPIAAFPGLNHSCSPLFHGAFPLLNRNSMIGVLLLSNTESSYDDCEIEIFHDLADHVSLAIDNVYLYEQNEQLLLEEERRRVARELHDSVNQKLFSLSLVAQGLRMRVGGTDRKIEAGLQEIGELAQASLTEMKEFVWKLHSDKNGDKGLEERLKLHAENLGLELIIHMSRRLPMPSRVEETLWKVGQEALNNVRKHACIDVVEVQFACDNQEARMRISDCGSGFDTQELHPGTLGLISMRERVLQVNGRFHIQSTVGRGTIIEVIVPLERGELQGED